MPRADARRPGDRPLHLRFRLAAVAGGVAFFGLGHLLARFPAVVEWVYAGHFDRAVLGPLSRLTGLVPVSLAEWLIAAFVLYEAAGAAFALGSVLRGRRRVLNAASCGLLRLGAKIGILVALFYVLWGFNYARAPLATRLGWPEAAARAGEGELERLAHETVEAANVAYVELHGVEDLGAPTPRPADWGALQRSIDATWPRVGALLPASGLGTAERYGPAKGLLSSRLLSRIGLEGFFFPFTAEANVNVAIPAVALAHAVAHEKAHQRGFGPEDEASFVGYLAASLADDPLARYSAEVFAQRQLLRALALRDPEAAGRVAAGRLPGVRRDLRDLARYWAKFRGPASEAAERVNDLYLRSNRVRGGTRSYGRSLVLLLQYAHEHGGTLRLPEVVR